MKGGPVRILFLSDFTKEADRQLISGLKQFLDSHGGCLFSYVSNLSDASSRAHAQRIVDKAVRIGADAVLGLWKGIDEKAAMDMGIPVILRTYDRLYDNFPMLTGGYETIGAMAAEFFLRQHYSSLGFLGQKGILWSEQRREGFARAAAAANASVSCLEMKNLSEGALRVADWLSSLKKPTGVLCSNDETARMLCDICFERGIRVPEDISVIGVDDDAFVCETSTPPLTSIHLDFERQGKDLGEALLKFLESGRTTPDHILIQATGITERNSTLRHRISDPVIERVVEYIDNNFKKDISYRDIVRNIPLSQRSLEMKFKKEMGPDTVLSYLNRLRVGHMCSLLRKGDISVKDAALSSGLYDRQNVVRNFRKITGMTPEEFRRNCSS